MHVESPQRPRSHDHVVRKYAEGGWVIYCRTHLIPVNFTIDRKLNTVVLLLVILFQFYKSHSESVMSTRYGS